MKNKTTAAMGADTLAKGLEAGFSAHGEKTALGFLRDGRLESELSYKDLDKDTRRTAAYFSSKGIGPKSRVILFAPKSVGFLMAHLALIRLGAVSVPVNPGFKQAEMAFLMENARPGLILAGMDQAKIIEGLNPSCPVEKLDTDRPYESVQSSSSPGPLPPAPIQPADPGTIIYTSGTTGPPKGAVLTQGNLAHDAFTVIRIWEISSSDRVCHALPLFHVHGLGFAVHTALLAGATLVMLDRFSSKKVLETLAIKDKDRFCTVFMAVPAMYVKMMETLGDQRPNFDHMRLWTSGSAPLLSKDFERIKEVFGKAPVEREGMSETGMNFSNPLNGPRKPGSIGLPLPGLSVKIVSPETGRELPAGRIGEIRLKGPGITPGYWRNQTETEKAFADGWFKTGDLGRVDEDGYYFLTDRLKNIIISGGENISPKEIESVLNLMEEVAESAVVGISDEKWGEKVVAAVRCKPGANPQADDIRRFCKQHLHDWKVPKEIRFVKEIPKNRMGKILVPEVRRFFAP